FESPYGNTSLIVKLFLDMFAMGGAGVIVFFMVSGYIILHVIQTEEVMPFLIKRFFRIYPLLILAISIEYIFQFVNQEPSVSWLTRLGQMSLLGDFFQVPHALAGVEWTLRIEILFYLLMALIKWIGWHQTSYRMVTVFVGVTILLHIFAPFPSVFWSVGYVSIFSPFLFLGSIIYLYEHKKINAYFAFGLSLLIFFNAIQLIKVHAPHLLISNFIVVGIFIFMMIWLLRDKLKSHLINSLMFRLSALTYAVYLFHNFIWAYFEKNFGVTTGSGKLILLFLVCWVVHHWIEKPINRWRKNLKILGSS
ncbi:MAG: acyltransferase, partial [Neisseriaceae bacterium]|nr:acyltransferase [Neisseriaceae bacterium]